MLILTRHKDEEIIIKVPPSDREQEVLVKVLKGSSVKLGFSADEGIKILRTELLDSDS